MEEKFGHAVNFLGLTKNKFDPRKLETARLKDINSNSFEFDSNGFELGLGKRKVHKC